MCVNVGEVGVGVVKYGLKSLRTEPKGSDQRSQLTATISFR